MKRSNWTLNSPNVLFLDGPTPGVLYEVDVPIMSNPECHDMFKKAGHEKRILDSFVCAGYTEGKKDSCEVISFKFQSFLIHLIVSSGEHRATVAVL